MKKLLINFAKLAISLGIIVYLVVDVRRNNPDLFATFLEGPKQWPLLATAFVLILGAVSLSFVRWYFLVRALRLPFSLGDAFRLGFLGYLLNFVYLGAVGGDLFKAVFIAREQPGRRTEAVTTIFVDRLSGLVGLLLLATGGLLVTDLSGYHAEIRMLAQFTLVATAISAAALGSLMFRFVSEGPIVGALCRLPRVGNFFQRVYEAATAYRQCRGALFVAVGMTLVLHSLNVMAFYCIANGLPEAAPSVAVHFFIIPVALVSSALPLPMEALGAFEFVLQYLYTQAAQPGVSTGQGLLVALAYRVIRIAVALVGVAFYLRGRREVTRVLHEVEEIEHDDEAAERDENLAEVAQNTASTVLPAAGPQ